MVTVSLGICNIVGAGFAGAYRQSATAARHHRHKMRDRQMKNSDVTAAF
jgi:hypothetical protein